MQTTVILQCIDQTLQPVHLPKLTSGGKKNIKFEFKTDEHWAGFGLAAVFYREEHLKHHAILVDGCCEVPWYVIAQPGLLYVGLYGTFGEKVHTSEVLPLNLWKGSTTGNAIEGPLPDVYAQLLSAYGSTNANLRAETAARKAEIAVERARITNLATMEEGSTTGDAELQDLRVDAGGVTHANAGEAVRDQVADLRRHHVKPNLIDLDKLNAGYLTDADNVTATKMTEDCYYSDYIPVDPALPYYLSVNNKLSYTSPWIAVSLYDVDRTLIKRQSWYESEKLLNFDEGVAYVRVSFRGLFLHNVKFEQSAYPTAAAVECDASPNLYDLYPLTLPGYVDSPGSIHNPTQEGYMAEGIVADEKYSRFIPVSAGEVYVVYNGVTSYPWTGIGFYNAEGGFISREVVKTGETEMAEVTVPDDAVAMRYSSRMHSRHSFVLYKKTGLNDYMDAYVKALIAERVASEAAPAHLLVKAVAHRGYSAGAPENTLPAFRMAKQKGFDYAECDVSFTSDGVAVLLHDNTIDRTSNGSGSISALSYAEVKALDFGSWYGEKFAGTTIPTFDEFMLACRNLGLKPYIELKAGNEEQITALVTSAKRHGLLGAATWISFSADYLGYVKNAHSKARLGYVVDSVTASAVSTAQGLLTGENEVFIDSNGCTAAEVELCVAAGLPMETWTKNSAATIQALPAYVSGVTSDSQHAGQVLYNMAVES